MTDDEIRLAYQNTQEGDPQGGCIPEAQLVRAATGAAGAFERERIADHLIACASCAEEYRLLMSLKPWAAESAAVLDPDAAPATADASVFPSRWLPYAVAASVAVAFAGGFWAGGVVDSRHAASPINTAPADTETVRQLADARQQVADLRRQVEDQQRAKATSPPVPDTIAAPEPNVPIVELESADAFRSVSARTRTIELPSSAKLVTFVIAAAAGVPGGTYRVDMADSNGRVIWSSSGLRPAANGALTVAVPRALLPAGEGRVRLYEERGSRRAPLEDYAVRFAYR